MGNMLKRFQGRAGRRLLRAALAQQSTLLGLDAAIDALVRALKLEVFQTDDELIVQDSADNDMFFILAGHVSIQVNGRELASRAAGEHVGEMALIDPSARRSATVIAMEETIVARVSEQQFVPVADNNPQIWRRLAMQLGNRLRQRNALIRLPNPIPRIFVGSSSETLNVAQCLAQHLRSPELHVDVWNKGIFDLSQTNIESLENSLRVSDFAVLVFGPDDKIASRGARLFAPRDNVILELGLFMGAIGRSRTFVVRPEKMRLKVPSDLLGVDTAGYSLARSRSLNDRIKPVARRIEGAVSKQGPL